MRKIYDQTKEVAKDFMRQGRSGLMDGPGATKDEYAAASTPSQLKPGYYRLESSASTATLGYAFVCEKCGVENQVWESFDTTYKCACGTKFNVEDEKKRLIYAKRQADAASGAHGNPVTRADLKAAPTEGELLWVKAKWPVRWVGSRASGPGMQIIGPTGRGGEITWGGKEPSDGWT